MTHLRRPRFPRPSSFLAVLGICALLLGACTANDKQFDPSGQNSGSPQNAQGAFNFDVSGANVQQGSINQEVNVYDSFSSVVTTINVTNAVATQDRANQNDNSVTLEDGMQYLVLTLNLTNTSASPTDCQNPKATNCVEYLSPLMNFRLRDSQGRIWGSTTGAKEACSTDPHTMCANRKWLDESVPRSDTHPDSGIGPGVTFTNTLAFYVPTSESNFTLFFAAYRFGDANSQLAGGTASKTPQATVAEIAINV